MKLTAFVLSLQLWAVVDVSLSLDACSKVPDFPHGHVSDDTNKSEYQEGDVIHFSCDAGFIADQTSKYICTSQGWLVIRQGTCYSCSTLPDVPHAHIAVETRKDEYREEDVIHFTCDLDDSSEVVIKYVCTSEGWLTIRNGSCNQTCKITGVPHNVNHQYVPGNELLKGRNLTFTCQLRNHFIHGHATVECLDNGQWSHSFPTCGTPVTCDNPPALLDGDTKDTLKFLYNHNERVEFRCQRFYIMEGEPYKTCFNGVWMGDMKCLKPCTVNAEAMDARNIRFKYRNRNKLYSTHNDEIDFDCKIGSPVQGSIMRARCLDGEIQLPTCQ